MKIRHNIMRDGTLLKGQILETIFEGSEERADAKIIKRGGYDIGSANYPQLKGHQLRVWGRHPGLDNNQIFYMYSSEEEAQGMLDFINSFTIFKEIDIELPDEFMKNFKPTFYTITNNKNEG